MSVVRADGMMKVPASSEGFAAGKEVQVNDEGYMTDPAEWNKDIAAAIAVYARRLALEIGGHQVATVGAPSAIVDRAADGRFADPDGGLREGRQLAAARQTEAESAKRLGAAESKVAEAQRLAAELSSL